METANVVLTFEDREGRKWVAGAVMLPPQMADSETECPLTEMPVRALVLKGFTVVTQ